MESSEIAFIKTLSKALGHKPETVEERSAALWPNTVNPEYRTLCQQVAQRTAEDYDRLMARLSRETGPLNIDLRRCAGREDARRAIVEILVTTEPEWDNAGDVVKWDHPLINDLDLETALGEKGITVHTAAFAGEKSHKEQRAGIRHNIESSFAGITSADFCLAQTATLVMKSRQKEARSVSLVPSIHIALIKKEQILLNLKELYAVLNCSNEPVKIPHHMVLVSGPSKTGDIELVMVHGAHGPRALHLIILE